MFTITYSFYQVSYTEERAATCQKILNHPIWWETKTEKPIDKCIYTKPVMFRYFLIIVVNTIFNKFKSY